MSSRNPAPSDLADAAEVLAARDAIVDAVASLAASPLDEPAAGAMRAALDRAASPVVRRAIGRLRGGPRLAAVPRPAADPDGGAA